MLHVSLIVYPNGKMTVMKNHLSLLVISKTNIIVLIIAHNQIKRDLYVELISYWKKAIEIASSKVEQGKIFGQQVVTEWAKQ
jgi:hypothetical protein